MALGLAEGLLSQMHFLPYTVVLRHDFLPPLFKYLYSIYKACIFLLDVENIELSLVKGSIEFCLQCTVNLDMAFCLFF